MAMTTTYAPELLDLEDELADEWEEELEAVLPGAVRGPAAPSWVGYMPPLPEDEADLFNAGPEAGHERIENDALGPLIRDRRRLAAIYFGNWQRDMSQLIVPAFPRVFGRRAGFVCDLVFEVVDVLAEAKFGRRLDRERFGTYRWEEHIDNPREYGVALRPRTCAPAPPGQRRPEEEPESPRLGLHFWREGPGGLPNYVVASQQYVLGQLALAMRYGPNDRAGRGLEHFGNAMHTVEDFYAHSNFIELALNRLRGRGDPKTGRLARSGQPVRDSLGRYRLTTGVFLLSDTLVSLQKLLLQHVEGRPPGTKPSNVGEKVIRVLVRRLLGQRVLTIYDQVMRAWEATGIPGLARSILAATGIPDAQRALEELVMRPLRHAIAGLLRPLVDAAARQTGGKAYPTPVGGQVVPVIEISHSQLAKDDPHHAYHGIARQLAGQAVRDFWRELEAAWSRRIQPQGPGLAGTRFRVLVDRYMNHPQAVGDWWAPTLMGVRPADAPARSRPSPARVPSRPTRRRRPMRETELEEEALALAGL